MHVPRPSGAVLRARQLRRASWWWVAGAVAAVALLARAVPVARGGGLHGLGNYDDAVYFAASTGLAHGLLPYRDFLLLHPPGVTLILLPFAGLGRLVGDADAMAVARAAFIAAGAANAVLVTRIVWSMGSAAALVAGLFASLFFPSAYIGRSTLLETPATTCTLVAVLILLRLPRYSVSAHRWLLGAGALLGFSASIKIWGVAVAAVVIGWVLVSLGLRRAVWTLIGVGLGPTVVCLPFFVAAPHQMWQMVVLDQLGRPATPAGGTLSRLSAITGLTPFESVRAEPSMIGVATALVLVCSAVAWRNRTGRLAVVVGLGSGLLLLSTPSWYFHYAGLTGAPLAVILGCAVAEVRAWSPRRWLGDTVIIAALVGLVLYAVPVFGTTFGRTFPAAQLGPGVDAVHGCVTADDPTTLIELNLLHRNLARHCPLVVDLSGYNYALPPLAGPPVPHAQNARWQRFSLDYLRSGAATVVIRTDPKYGLTRASAAVVSSWPVSVNAGDFTVQIPQAGPLPDGG